MSAIVGIYHLDGRSAEAPALERMLEAVAHRGWDASGAWQGGHVGLGHRMLWTTPESLEEKLPAVSAAGDLVVTADARLDNRDELLRLFDLPPNEAGGTSETRRTVTDSELILAAYRRFGERCAERLLGDFAFAIWDLRRERLFCARDPIGLKPFYYHYRRGGIFVFGSEVKALLAVPAVPRRVNAARVSDFLVGLYEGPAATFHDEILRLPPAHRLSVSREGVSLRRYWELDPSRELALGSDAEYAEAFGELFADAIRCRLRSAYPLGVPFSGGIDSAAVVCASRKLLAESGAPPLNTFTSLHEGIGDADDRPYMEAVLRQGSLEAHVIEGEEIGPTSHVDELVRVLDGPYDNAHLSAGWKLRSLIQEHDVRVVLGGDGGDDSVFYGSVYLTELARSGHWINLLREAKGLAQQHWGGRISTWTVLQRAAIAPFLPSGLRRFALRHRGGNLTRSAPDQLVSAKLAQRFELSARLEARADERFSARGFRTEHCAHLQGAQIPYALESANLMSAPFGFENRPPFFDRRIVELCLALPRKQKVHRGMTRLVVRRALVDLLPEEVRRRGTKGGPNLNFARNFLRFERETLEDLVRTEAEVIDDYVDIDALRNVCDRFMRDCNETDGYPLWTAISLARWLRSAGLTH